MSMWNYEWFTTPGAAVFDRDVQQVAAVSRAPGNLDLFVIGFDNHIWTTYWNDQVGWSGDWFPVPGAAVFDRTVQQVAAVSRAPGNLDLFVIGFDNHIWTTYWNDQVGWSADWFPVPGAAVFDRTVQQVAAVSRAPGNLDLFVIGFDNHVWTTYWNDAGGWSADFFPLPGQAVFDRSVQQLAAVSRAPGNLDVFVIGFDNHVWTTYWNDAGGWSADFFPLPGQAVFDRSVQQLAAVSRAPGNLDLFVIGFDNHVWTTYWNDAGGWSADFFPLPGQAVFDHTQQQLAAVSRAPGNLDVFVIGFDNHVWTTYWNDAGGWSADFFPLPGQAVFDRDQQQLAVVSRAPDNLDVFVIGFDNHIWTTYWGASTTSMTKLIDNGPFGAKITMVVVGDGFGVNDQHAYNDAVDALLTNGLFTQDFFAANKSAFNLVRLNVSSVDSGVSTKTYDAAGNVTAHTDHNTAFGAIFNGDWAHCWVEDGPDTAKLLNQVLSAWVPDHKLLFLLLNNPGFGGCGGGGRLTLPLGVTWATVAHECGHALGGLADEYHQKNDAYSGGEPGAANVTIDTNRNSLKWAWALNAMTPVPTGGDDYNPPKPAGWDDNQGVGLFEGGMADYSTGIYRPVVNCRMRGNNPPYCPVCNAAMTGQVAPFAAPAPGPTPSGQEGTSVEMADSYLRMTVRMRGDQLEIVDAREVQGPLVQAQALPPGLVHEVVVDGRRVAMDSSPDVAVSRSFSEPTVDGPAEHHIYEPGTVEFQVRVPVAALQGASPDSVSVNVVSLQAPVEGEVPLQTRLHEAAALDAEQQASVNLGQTHLPNALRRMLSTP